jgi:hypothetical protein
MRGQEIIAEQGDAPIQFTARISALLAGKPRLAGDPVNELLIRHAEPAEDIG